MIALTTTDGLKAAATAWPGGRPLHVEAFGRRMVAAEAVGDDGTILLRLKDDGARPSLETEIATLRQQLAAAQAANTELEADLAAARETAESYLHRAERAEGGA